MGRIATIAGLAMTLACLSAPALAKGEIPFEKAKGWDIERSAPGAKAQRCMMSKSYNDPDDDDAENGIVLVLAEGRAFVTLAYENWSWDKDEKVRVPLLLDKKLVDARSEWTGDGKVLSAVLPESVVPYMLASKKAILRFSDGEADFDLSGFADAYESLRRCDATPAHLTGPGAPSEERIKAFFVASMVEAAMRECEVPTTGTQRAAFGDKLATLRKEMAPLEETVREAVEKRPEPRCPSAEEAPGLQVSIQDFIERSPEDFIAAAERRAAESVAAARAQPKP